MFLGSEGSPFFRNFHMVCCQDCAKKRADSNKAVEHVQDLQTGHATHEAALVLKKIVGVLRTLQGLSTQSLPQMVVSQNKGTPI